MWRIAGWAIACGFLGAGCMHRVQADLTEGEAGRSPAAVHLWVPEGAADEEGFIMVVARTLPRDESMRRMELPVEDDYSSLAGRIGYDTRPVREEHLRASLPVMLVEQVVDPQTPQRPPEIRIDYRFPGHPSVVRFFIELAVADRPDRTSRFGKEVLMTAL
jgi:hypothetical protein